MKKTWQAWRRKAALPPDDLLRDPVYRRLWTSILISSFGGQVTMLALPLTAAVLLHALTYLDGRLLWDSPWNLGILYLLPEVRAPRFDEFHRQRSQLRQAYRTLVHRVLDGRQRCADEFDVGADEDVVFRLVESLPNLRADGLGEPDQPQRTADMALHVLGWRGDWPALRAASRAVTDEVG